MRKLLIFGTVFAFLVVLSLFYLFSSTKTALPEGAVIEAGPLFVTKTVKYPISVSVIPSNATQTLGISVDYGKLEYGILPKGSSATKYINLTNHDEPVKITMLVTGTIKDMIKIEKNDFILHTYEKIPVKLNASKTGNFSGELEIRATKPKTWFSKWLISWI